MAVKRVDEVSKIVDECIKLSVDDWDSFEVSWNFKEHPLVRNHYSLIENAFNTWAEERYQAFNKLKENEEN